MLSVIHQHVEHWENLGILLGLQDYDIANIARDYPKSVDACREMFTVWLQTVSSPTWGKLDDAINSLMTISTSRPTGKFLLAYSVLYRNKSNSSFQAHNYIAITI